LKLTGELLAAPDSLLTADYQVELTVVLLHLDVNRNDFGTI